MTRELSLWSIFQKPDPPKPESPTQPPASPSPPPTSTSTSSSPQSLSPEHKLTESLRQAEENRQTTLRAAQKETDQQLLAWGETDPVSEAISPPFQDPLGHLTFPEQIAYLANPPDEYLRTLEDRAGVRESYEREIFLADPITHWKLAYDVKPDLGGSSLPSWKPWDQDKRLEMMERYRRYDERFQRKVQEIFEFFSSEDYVKRTARQVMYRIQKDIKQSAIAAAKKKGKGSKKDVLAALVLEEPPFKVIERKVHRVAIKSRNDALNRLWFQHMQEVSVFDDLNEEGLTVSEARKRKLPEVIEQKKVEEEKQKKAIKEWGTLPTDVKVESIDWRAITGES